MNKIIYIVLLSILPFLKTYSQANIIVSNSEEFIKSLKSNSKITLKEGTYYISTKDSTLLGLNEHYKKSNENWWFPVLFDNLKNVEIKGLGKVKIISKDSENYVLTFNNCINLKIENITIGHDVKGECSGGTIRIQNSSKIILSKLNIYGSGTIGLDIDNVNTIDVYNSKIYDCSIYSTSIYNSKNIIFKNSIFENSKLKKVMYLYDLNKILIDNCIIRNNIGVEPITESTIILYNDEIKEGIVFKNTIIENNTIFEEFTNDNKKIKMIKCSFKKNNFNYTNSNKRNSYKESVIKAE